MKTGWIIGVLFMAALMLAALFAVGGAGLYGSPFGRGGTSAEYPIYAIVILIGPLATLLALGLLKRLPKLSGLSLLLGALAGFVIGLVVDASGNIYVADSGADIIIKGTPLARRPIRDKHH